MALINASVINSGLPQLPEGVPTEAYAHFLLIYNAIHKLESLIAQYTGADGEASAYWSQISMDSTILSGNLNRFYAIAAEALSFGQAISLLDSGGVTKIQKANATTNAKPCVGFVTSPGNTALGAYCEVQLGIGLITGVSGMTRAARYFLSTTSGLITNAAPVAAGNIEQPIGFALATNRLFMNVSGNWIQH